ncbi:ArgP/LysG family DNA-binding transcriptional regulator [Arsenicicoccus sp. oral taxon 190]|uniref:ArgP/LysG family DNA-binding transcriptional regulator n=1 Tax=Arsenicicoccus sp. oral taxon 190 TaxID=1658671 RepID=UPI000679F0BE|nr:ArgP/LysG family DNA-binding transcriptional regulator [Arsenicicoccus sp. oral taxon 190]AKT50509.1 hypothetical protein ADJ73_02835 [Arsenicicoccus sp. oral taxon 190]
MRLDPQQLAALRAVVQHGTFDAAAVTLGVTPSAVSQRVKALEREVGQVVVRRVRPCRPTGAGEVLLRMATQLALVEAEAEAALRPTEAGPVPLSVAVNADSLGTWFRQVLAAVAQDQQVALTVLAEDQGHSAELLRSGAVMAAVTADPAAVQGCSVVELRPMRYLPVATPALVERHLSRGRKRDGLARMPMVRFNAKDDLQHEVLRRLDAPDPAVVHHVPSTEDFAVAVRLGLGWGMLPEQQLGDDLQAGRLVRVARGAVSVPLYWQRWRIESAALDRLTGWVRAAAVSGAARPR